MGKIIHQALLLIVVLLLICLSFGTSESKKSNDLIEETCGKTQKRSVCVSALRSDPRSSIADVSGLARIIFEITAVKANNTIPYIEKLRDGSRGSVPKWWCDSCIALYEEIPRTTCPIGIEFLDEKNYGAASASASYWKSVAKHCEMEFPRSNKSPLYRQNKALMDLGFVAIDILNLLT